jgi:hypothetical protein
LLGERRVIYDESVWRWIDNGAKTGWQGSNAEFSKTLIGRELAEIRVKRLKAAFGHLVDDASARGE